MPPKATTTAARSKSRATAASRSPSTPATPTRAISPTPAAPRPTPLPSPAAAILTDRFHPGLDYGNVIYDRRHRFLATYLYDLPFGHGQRWLNSGSALNRLVGDWQLGRRHHPAERPVPHALSSSPSTRPTPTSSPPSARRAPISCTASRSTRPQRTTTQWLNPAAFPYLNLQNSPLAIGIGRFGNAPVGGVVGPGTDNFSLSLMKSFSLHEQTQVCSSALKRPTSSTIATTSRPTCRWTRPASAPSPRCKPPKAPARAAWNSPAASRSRLHRNAVWRSLVHSQKGVILSTGRRGDRSRMICELWVDNCELPPKWPAPMELIHRGRRCFRQKDS